MHKMTMFLVASILFATITVIAEDKPTAMDRNDEAQTFRIIAESYSFTPDRIVARAGIPVILIVEKKGIIPHDFVIDDPAFGLSIKESLSGTTKIEFTPMKKGKFEFYCGKDLPFFKSHHEKGMHGILEIR